MRARRRWALGLRGRIVGALVLTSVATLGVAALGLLSPLERRLRAREVSALSGTVLTARPSFAALPAADVAPGSPALGRTVRALARRTGGRVVFLDRDLRPLFATDPDATDLYEDVERGYLEDRTIAGTDPGGGTETARVAVPVKIAGRLYAIAARKPIAEVKAATHVVARAFGAAALVGLAFALVAGFGLATTLVRRLRRLRTLSLRMAEEGPAAAELPAAGREGQDEVGDLARAFATMQSRLRLQEEARRAFVATASHELRTPLASLQGMLELLQDDLDAAHPDMGDARDQVERARGQARRLSRLAADLLDLSRLDAEVPLRSEEVELGELSRAVLAEFEVRAEEKGVVLALEAVPGPCWARADPGSVAQIVRILLDNALRVTPVGERVTIALIEPEGRAGLCVGDGGPGVPDGEREIIFARFQRGTTTGGEPGFGLGLALGRELAERMEGTLVLEEVSGGGGERRESESESAGAQFTLSLPVAPAAEEPSPRTTLKA